MNYVFRFTAACICVLAIAGSIATAQDLQQQLSKLGKDAAIGYTSPLLSGFGNDLNSGIYYSAERIMIRSILTPRSSARFFSSAR